MLLVANLRKPMALLNNKRSLTFPSSPMNELFRDEASVEITQTKELMAGVMSEVSRYGD